MDSKQLKPKRRKKNKSRTQVSSDSDSDYEIQHTTKSPSPPQTSKPTKTVKGPKTDAEISAVFTQFYMQRATQEFAEDLDKVRGADDFKDDSVAMLVGALKQGVEVFSAEERRRVVMAKEGRGN
ncbi:Ribosome assembly protein [Lachnellula subtilissima]|uniref:Ribosome assembly protein 3 n=1 Tax=Lachnellula subtilissima TaxID=602034 RepID=A0A8H8RGW3_9HELO|nr:Ribosome assembly protein [Lachnellula subtilissima]